MNETTRRKEYTTEGVLYLAFELSHAKWKLGFTVGLGQNPCQRASRNMTREEWLQFIGQEEYQATCPQLPVPGE